MGTYTGTTLDDFLQLIDLNADDQVNDSYYGYGGRDTFVIGRGSDMAFGGSGDDTFILDPDSLDTPIGPTGIFGGQGVDRLQLFSIWFDTATIRLTTGSQIVSPTLSYTSIEEFSFTGGDRAERIFGSRGDDLIQGWGGNDRLRGGGGNDDLDGGLGRDTLTGGAGDDQMKGDSVSDGRISADVFVFDTALSTFKTVGGVQIVDVENVDLIVGFDRLDKIELDHAIFTGLATGRLDADAYYRSANGQAGDAQDRIIVNTTTGQIAIDQDGTGTRFDAIVFAQCISFLFQPVLAGLSDFEVI